MNVDHIWTPIDPLSEQELAIDVQEFDSLATSWEDARSSLEQENSVALERFRERLRRSWSVETGILENLYMIDRGATQTMIDRGFHQDLINRTSTDIDPARLVDILKDHLVASDMIQKAVQDNDKLSPVFIRQLHALITRHQETVEAVVSLGNLVRTEPLRGQWKKLPNWRKREDGQQLPYCPPEQVEGQIADLLAYLQLQKDDRISSALLAAWLHHRFTLIHPFQDGNGRIARALVNFLFIEHGLFPVVVDRDDKPQYIDALHLADEGDLSDLVNLVSGRQVEAIKQALSLARGAELEQSTKVKDLASGILHQATQRRQREQVQFREVNAVLDGLFECAKNLLGGQLDEFRDRLVKGGMAISADLDAGGSFDDRAHYYRWETVESAKLAHQWANFDEDSRWVRALVENESTRLRFLVLFHHIGRELTGVAEVTTIADLVTPGGADASSSPDRRSEVYSMVRPFSITWRDDVGDLLGRFETWVEECFLVALRAWSDTL